MSKKKGLNEEAWEKLFEKHHILDYIEKQGYFVITAEQIKEYREPRLMAKFDHKINLPSIFVNHYLSILPQTRGTYIIAPVKAYHNFEPDFRTPKRFPPPEHIESINFSQITSEAVALNSAYVSGILADFFEDEEIVPTLSGRMASGSFAFDIERVDRGHQNIQINNSQVEIDGGYEGLRNLFLTEVKLSLSEDFIIRQLYYPFRAWHNTVNKEIKTVFIMFTNGLFRLYQYKFEDPLNYNSLVLMKQKNYSIEGAKITLDDILSVSRSVLLQEEPKIAFPQADDFNRVINLCELLNISSMTRDEITSNYDFDPRQTNYYADAGRYLGLIEKYRQRHMVKFYLTSLGKEVQKMQYKSRQLKYVALILQHQPFKETLEQTLKMERKLNKDEIVEIMKKCDLYRVRGESTYYRRASTVKAWVEWILGLQRIY